MTAFKTSLFKLQFAPQTALAEAMAFPGKKTLVVNHVTGAEVLFHARRPNDSSVYSFDVMDVEGVELGKQIKYAFESASEEKLRVELVFPELLMHQGVEIGRIRRRMIFTPTPKNVPVFVRG